MRTQWLWGVGLAVLLMVPQTAAALQFVPHTIDAAAGTIGPGSIDSHDLDDDGDIDIVAAGSEGVAIYGNDNQGVFTKRIVSRLAAQRVRLVDLNDDERLDLLVLLTEQAALWYANLGELAFWKNEFATEGEATATAADLWREVDMVATADVDGDGDSDVVASDAEHGSLYWYEMTTEAAGATVSPLPSPTSQPASPTNQPPLAEAGRDVVVPLGETLLLDGRSSSDPEGTALTYEWRQLDGPPVELLAARTSSPSFKAEVAGASYIFLLTVQDNQRAAAIDTVTVATAERAGQVLAASSSAEMDVGRWWRWVNGGWWVMALWLTGWLAGQRWWQRYRERQNGGETVDAAGRVLHYQTGQPVAGAQVFIYDRDNKLKATERTNEQGAWPTLFPPGEYSLKVAADGFEVAGSALPVVRSTAVGILYTGGFFTVPADSGPLSIVIPVRPLTAEAKMVGRWLSTGTQGVTWLAQWLSWPVIGLGAVLSAGWLWWKPSVDGLVMEALYAVVAVGRLAAGWQRRYGQHGMVRDVSSGAGVDLAVVRLFTAETNRLVMTRVTNAQGQFFALPPAGLYTVMVTKPGYSNFTREHVVMGKGSGRLVVDLLPLQPLV